MMRNLISMLIDCIASIFDDREIYKKAKIDCEKIFIAGGKKAVLAHIESMRKKATSFDDLSYVRGALKAYDKLSEAKQCS